MKLTSIFLTDRGLLIEKALNEIGCEIEINTPGKPAIINHSNFHPRPSKPVPSPIYNADRDLSPRELILNRYYNECANYNIPVFVSWGRCVFCGFDLVDIENNCMKSTTGCPSCKKSFCE